MTRVLEFSFSLPLVMVFWLWLFPVMGATASDLSLVLLALIVIAYSALTVNLFQLFHAAQILIGARFNATLVFAGLLATQLTIPFAVVAVFGLSVPGLVLSYGKLALAISIGFVCQYVLMVVIGPLRRRLDIYEEQKKTTLLIENDTVYIPVIRHGRLIPDRLLIIEPERLEATEQLLCIAWRSGLVDRNWEVSDRTMLEAIPRLAGCHFLGVLRLQVAFLVLRQSYKAAGNREKAACMQERYEDLSRVYCERGAY